MDKVEISREKPQAHPRSNKLVGPTFRQVGGEVVEQNVEIMRRLLEGARNSNQFIFFAALSMAFSLQC